MIADRKALNINGAQYSAKKANAALHPSDVIIKGITYTINMADFSPANGTVNTPMMTTYHVSASWHSDDTTGALVDCGANNGIAGADCHIIKGMDHFINVEGIDNQVMEKHPIVTAGGITNSNRGPVILIMNQYAYVGKGTSIHSSPQMEW